MTSYDAFWATFQRRTFVDGSAFYGAAEVLEKEGMFGPAARFYYEAQIAFGFGKHLSASLTAKSASERCCRKAVAHGEEPAIAFRPPGPPKEEIIADPRGFVAWYYNRHAKMLFEAVEKAATDENWQTLEKLIKLSEGWQPFLEDRNSLVIHHLIANSTGFMLRARGARREAIQQFHEAYKLAKAGAFKNPPWILPQDLAIDSFYLGRALFEAGDESAESHLQQAVKHLLEFPSNTKLLLAGADAALYLSQQYLRKAEDTEYARAAMEEDLRALRIYADAGNGDRVAQTFVQTARVCSAGPADIRWELRALVAETLYRLGKEKDPDTVERVTRELRQAQSSSPGLEGIEQEVDSAPKRFLDADTARAKRLLKTERLADVQGILERIETRRVEGYTPSEYDQVRKDFNMRKARQLAKQAKQEYASGKLGAAIAILEAALALGGLPEAMVAQLQQSARAVKTRIAEAVRQARSAIQQLVAKQDWDAVRKKLEEAEQIGIGRALESERNAIQRRDLEQKEKVQNVIEEAAQAMTKVKTVDRILSGSACVFWVILILQYGLDKGFLLGLAILLPVAIPMEVVLYIWRRRILSQCRERVLLLAGSVDAAKPDFKAFATERGLARLFAD